MADKLRWTVYVEYLDGAVDAAIGDPEEVGGSLRVAVEENDGMRVSTSFEARFPLAHVRAWWCDYAHDTTRKNAVGRRWRVREPGETPPC